MMPILKTAFCLAMMMSANAFAATAAFLDRPHDDAVDTATLNAPLHKYRALTMNIDAIRSQLRDAPDEHAAAPASTLDLPMPDGTTLRFNVWRTRVMVPQLAAQFPLLRSYVARAVNHPQIEARLDDSPHGFSAMIRSPDGVTMVQPVRLRETARYISFRRADLGASAEPFRCLEYQFASSMRSYVDTAPAAPQTTTGATIRTYRLAVAATGEYTAFFGGTVADGMAAIVEAINRINGIYLTEFAVQFQLVANNNLLVYTDAATDPYTNDDGNAMLGQNQTTINSVIGSANYDFGHVFSTGAGGVAFLGVACTNSKARGVTGTSTPVGDAFWVDYVAHEMGHQMGANHSFNTTDGFCSGNRAQSQAAEPGSGSTIMAYAGICGPSDLQPHSDPFFHAISLVPIQKRLGTTGGGAVCGAAQTATNQAPVLISVGPHTIPAQTPFVLTGAATDADGDALTYIWEEMDTGSSSPPEGDNGNRALFRSFVPTTSPARLVPELPRILNHDLSVDIPTNGDIPGESWATTTRALKFRLTVRDNHPGGGASASMDTIVSVTADSGPFRVTAPVGDATWFAFEDQDVTWDVANTTAAPVSCASVDILYSADGGQTFATLASDVPNSGTATVTPPDVATSSARIEVACHDNIFFDISPADFSIVNDRIFADDFDGGD